MIQWFLFIFDFFAMALFDLWIIFSLIAYFLYLIVFRPADKYPLYTTLGLVLLQDCFWYGRFGLGLLTIIPVFICGWLARSVFDRYWYILWYFVLIAFYFTLDHFLVKKWLFCLNSPLESIFLKIFGTIIVGILILLGTQGNRFLRNF